ncbi:MAG: helix-turn-helix domain-containing protein [Geminicoccaceae bacterium]
MTDTFLRTSHDARLRNRMACCVYFEYERRERRHGDAAMTMPAFAEPIGSRLPSADEKSNANQLRKVLAAQIAGGGSKLKVVDEATRQPLEITLGPALSDLLMELLRHVGRGDAVTIVPVGQMLTTQQAADILNVSRPFLISLLEKGDIEYSLVGRHRRIEAERLFAYKRKRDEKRGRALAELAELDADSL